MSKLYTVYSILKLALTLAWIAVCRHITRIVPLLVLAGTANGYGLQLEEFSVQGAKMNAASRDPIAPEYTGYWDYRAQANFRFNLFEALYWDNNVHTEAAYGAVRTVGWHWVLGLRVTAQIDVFHEHHSRHAMDRRPDSYDNYGSAPRKNAFPVEDSYGIKFNIYNADKNGRSIL
jgi:hypothetical protein